MPGGRVQFDEHGPWIDLGRAEGALRPAAPTRFEVGEELACRHVGGSTIHGVGKLAGRGLWREAWLSGPKSTAAAAAEGEADWDMAWEARLFDLALFHRGNPGFAPVAAGLSLARLGQLKRGRSKYLEDSGFLHELMRRKAELLSDGAGHAGAILAAWAAREIEGAVEMAACVSATARAKAKRRI